MTTKSPVRVIIKPADQELLGQLQDTTGLGNSELITILLRKYGVTFLQWFRTKDQGCNYPPALTASIEPTPELPAQTSQDFAAFEL